LIAIRVSKKDFAVCVKFFVAALSAVLAILTVPLRDAHLAAQDFPAVIARIEGDDLQVATPTPSGVQTNASPTVVASGSDVTVRSGHALLMLNTGGEVSVCGPAHFHVIESSGAVTLALDYGRVHPALENSEGLTIYTPTVVATPVAIAGGLREATLGLETTGEMCVLAHRGAMRVEPQFAGQSMIVPQGGSVILAGGQLSSLTADASACSCDYPRARLDSPAPKQPASADAGEHASPALDIAALTAPAAPPSRRVDNTAPPAPSGKEPVYTVLMPALSFSANSPEPPPATASTSAPAEEAILLVREVRLRPLFEYRGHVNPAPAVERYNVSPEASSPSPSGATPGAAPEPTPPKQSPAPKPGLLDRFREFFRRWTTDNETSPCAGVGCKA
jgi:hypothetical protein